jgi:hypothetical protein
MFAVKNPTQQALHVPQGLLAVSVNLPSITINLFTLAPIVLECFLMILIHSTSFWSASTLTCAFENCVAFLISRCR